MDQDILSLKNIYRFLTVYDYPVYSIGIIREEDKKGLTLNKFWQKILLPIWRSGASGRVIWRCSGNRNRYLSEICNRNLQIRHFEEYAMEVIANISSDTILQQMYRFTDFLVDKRYQYEAFMQKWPLFLKMLCQKDELFHEETARLFQENERYRESMEAAGERGKLFYVSWILTMSVLHALTGPLMSGREMAAIRTDKQYNMMNLWNGSQEAYQSDKGTLQYLNRMADAWIEEAVPRQHFFGREFELFDLREKLHQGGKYILTGSSGVGKTELLRQFLLYCHSEKAIDALMVVPYQGDLEGSVLRANSVEWGAGPMDAMSRLQAGIQALRGKKVLLLIDHVDHGPEEDKALEILIDLPCHILITAERLQLKGFEEIFLGNISAESALLIFRDNYGMPLSERDCQVMERLFEQENCRNTQLLCRLGRLAARERWTVEELERKIAGPACFREELLYQQ